MARSFLKLLSNTKTRTLVLLTAGVLITGIIIAIANSGKTGEPLEQYASKTTMVPKGVESTPGAKTSEKYRELQEKANTLGAEKAERKGGTFIPTIVANNKNTENEDLQSQFLKALEQTELSKNAATGNNNLLNDPRYAHLLNDPRYAELLKNPDLLNDPRYAELLKNPNLLNDPRYAELLKNLNSNQGSKLSQLIAQQRQDDEAIEAINKQRQAQLNAERMAAISEQRLKAIETVAQAMEEQTKAAFTAWSDVPQQVYTSGEWESNKNKSSATNNNTSSVDTRPIILKAGTILFGALETAVNSDEPGPIMAKIVQAPFKDAKLLGKIELPAEGGEKITLRFDTLSIPTETSSTKINAVAIDPDTARTALASEVNHHYLVRWGTLFGSAFLSGYAKAVSKSGTTVQASTVAGQANTVTTTPPLSGRQQFFEGLGEVGTKWSDQLKDLANRKPTITINSGTGLGILILADVKLGPEPIITQPTQNNSNTTTQQKALNSMDLLSSIVQNAANISSQTSNNVTLPTNNAVSGGNNIEASQNN